MDVRHIATATVVAVVSDHDAALIKASLNPEHAVVLRQRWPADAADGTSSWERPDVVVLDGAADDDDVVRRVGHLRRRWPTIGIAIVNAIDEGCVAEWLDAGADEAIVRGSRLLGPRLQAIVRRARTLNAGSRVAVGDITFDRETRRVSCAGREVPMTPREVAVLECMFRNAPRTVGTVTLADFVWGDDEASAESRRSVVEVYIGYLRRKLANSRSVMIRTVRGVGYRFDQRG